MPDFECHNEGCNEMLYWKQPYKPGDVPLEVETHEPHRCQGQRRDRPADPKPTNKPYKVTKETKIVIDGLEALVEFLTRVKGSFTLIKHLQYHIARLKEAQ